jgi:hypothetical protein
MNGQEQAFPSTNPLSDKDIGLTKYEWLMGMALSNPKLAWHSQDYFPSDSIRRCDLYVEAMLKQFSEENP